MFSKIVSKYLSLTNFKRTIFIKYLLCSVRPKWCMPVTVRATGSIEMLHLLAISLLAFKVDNGDTNDRLRNNVETKHNYVAVILRI